MKFLVTATPIPNAPPLPPDPDRPAKALDQIAKGKANGNWLCGYMKVDSGGFSVMEASSAEELFAAVHDWPFYALHHWQIEPLADIESSLKRMTEQAKAKK
jgi:hypothetical protein